MALTQRTLATLEDLEQEAEQFARSLAPLESGALLVTLSGELGAGKTTFTQGVAKALGVAEHITSPTFVLEKIYALSPSAGQGFERLVHIDAYRLEHAEQAQLAPLGFTELMQDAKNLILLEWPEKVANELPEASVRISFEVLEDTGRKITYA